MQRDRSLQIKELRPARFPRIGSPRPAISPQIRYATAFLPQLVLDRVSREKKSPRPSRLVLTGGSGVSKVETGSSLEFGPHSISVWKIVQRLRSGSAQMAPSVFSGNEMANGS